MRSLILSTTARFLLPLLLLFSVSLLLRGHDEPGGGFSAGLVAATAFALYAFSSDPTVGGEPQRLLRVEPRVLTGAGLLVAAGSGVAPLLVGRPFLAGLWARIDAPLLGKLHLGTPLLFDVGVYLVVSGITLTALFQLAAGSAGNGAGAGASKGSGPGVTPAEPPHREGR